MRKTFILSILLLTFFINSVTAQNTLETTTPKGWVKSITSSEDDIIGTDTVVKHSGKASAIIKAPRVDYPYYSGLYQNIDATEFRGKRIRISAFLKSDALLKAWMGASIQSVDTTSLAFANTIKNAVEETTDWKRYDILLDVAENARYISFHFVKQGDGTLWIDDCSISTVEKKGLSDDFLTDLTRFKKVTTTKQPPQKAINLDFETF